MRKLPKKAKPLKPLFDYGVVPVDDGEWQLVVRDRGPVGAPVVSKQRGHVAALWVMEGIRAGYLDEQSMSFTT